MVFKILVFETDLLDFRRMTVTVMKHLSRNPETPTKNIKLPKHKHFDKKNFREELLSELCNTNIKSTNDKFYDFIVLFKLRPASITIL